MIQYTEKGYGLHEAIRKAGHSLKQENGEWVSSDDAAVQAIIDGYTLDQAKELVRAQISARAKTLRDKAIAHVSAGEMASWPIKLMEAQGFAQGGSTPMLDAEAAARGITTAALVAKVGGNAVFFSALEASIAGTEGKHRDAVQALGGFDLVVVYDFSAHWPEV